MTYTINVDPETEAIILRRAGRLGISVADYMARMAVQSAHKTRRPRSTRSGRQNAGFEMNPKPEAQAAIPAPANEGMIAALIEIGERQKQRRHTDGSGTGNMLREARAGAMWGHAPIE